MLQMYALLFVSKIRSQMQGRGRAPNILTKVSVFIFFVETDCVYSSSPPEAPLFSDCISARNYLIEPNSTVTLFTGNQLSAKPNKSI